MFELLPDAEGSLQPCMLCIGKPTRPPPWSSLSTATSFPARRKISLSRGRRSFLSIGLSTMLRYLCSTVINFSNLNRKLPLRCYLFLFQSSSKSDKPSGMSRYYFPSLFVIWFIGILIHLIACQSSQGEAGTGGLLFALRQHHVHGQCAAYRIQQGCVAP